MRNRSSTLVISGVVALLAVGAIWLFNFERGPRVEARLHRTIGQALAREALKLRGPSGGITVIGRDTEVFPQPAMDLLLASFEREIRRGGATIDTTRLIQVDPLRPVQVPPGDFFEWIRKAPAGSVIVSFLGPPLLPEDQVHQLGAIKPAIVAFCPGSMSDMVDVRMLFERRLLQAAILSRPESTRATPSGPVVRPNSFDQLYTVVTAANLPAPPASSVPSP